MRYAYTVLATLHSLALPFVRSEWRIPIVLLGVMFAILAVAWRKG
jgi:hypothetical protein